jgi:hypothetical protein
MKKRVMILFAGLLVSAGLQAQRVYIETDGQGNKKRVILDLTEGMPAGAITSDSKTVMFNNLIAQHGAPSSTSAIWRSENQEGGYDETRGEINATVFQKFEIAPLNVNAATGTMGATPTYTADWAAAFNACKNSTHNGDNDWRLPTQRELQMMWIFKEALDTAFSKLSPSGTGNALLSADYRSATEYNASYAWNVNFGNGYTDYAYKTGSTSYRVRCVREVTP